MKQYNKSTTKESERDLWRTPIEVVMTIRDKFDVSFDVDLCADKSNSICRRYFSCLDDFNSTCLEQYYVGWINPPFSKKNLITDAVKKCQEQKLLEVVFALLPDKPETKLFQELEERATYVCRFNKRINFLRPSGESVTGVPFGSVVFVFHRAYVPGMCQQVRLEI